ncbi:LacI family DNA-binding transcriptional regulator [Kosmotoga pacifica]|uniref:Transcriptional regulator, LacI family protein n=1 Tax=Kosmotoga pacifica TaxID=1330330 RepID=A0A0G2ZEU2_9BACT|nr:LacI family DNA-binding transcriptional regulator [Kosmotoga pacifica]AKI97353.1 transcriptional regulator, LacI family protein [Kosmotoga pacifica]
MSSKLTRLIDVAKLAKVSTATVSRVINNSGYVSAEVKERVLKAIEELGYQPAKAARFLAKSRQNFKISIVADDWVLKSITTALDEFYSIVYKGIIDFSKNHRMSIELQDISSWDRGVDGFLLMGGGITKELVKEIKDTGKPVVLVDQYIPGLKVDCVVSDGYDGAVFAVDKLISKGLKRIVHIHGPLSHFGFRDRYDGYVATMERHGFMPRTYEFDEISDNMGVIIDMMLRNYGKPEAIFGSNDTAAIRAMDELKIRGYSIPEDVSIVGFDDIMSASLITPKLTTLKIFKYDLGSIAARRLFNLLMGEETHPIKISLFTQYIERESTI